MVRFRVVEEKWHDQTPTKPIEQAEEADKGHEPPYVIRGSMNDVGLGVCLWWGE